MKKKPFSSITGKRAQLEKKLIEATLLGDKETADKISAQLAPAPNLRLVPVGRDDDHT